MNRFEDESGPVTLMASGRTIMDPAAYNQPGTRADTGGFHTLPVPCLWMWVSIPGRPGVNLRPPGR